MVQELHAIGLSGLCTSVCSVSQEYKKLHVEVWRPPSPTQPMCMDQELCTISQVGSVTPYGASHTSAGSHTWRHEVRLAQPGPWFIGWELHTISPRGLCTSVCGFPTTQLPVHMLATGWAFHVGLPPKPPCSLSSHPHTYTLPLNCPSGSSHSAQLHPQPWLSPASTLAPTPATQGPPSPTSAPHP